MNNFLSTTSPRRFYSLVLSIFILLVVFLFIYFGRYSHEKNIVISWTTIPNIFSYVIGVTVVIIAFFLVVFFEIKIVNKERREQLIKYEESQLYIQELLEQLPSNIKRASFYFKLKAYCKKSWNKGNINECFFYMKLIKELLEYVVRMKEVETMVFWKEEMLYVNKLLEVMKVFNHEDNVEIELFEISANYRFPIGLFFIPLFNAIETSIKIKESFLRVECYSIGGIWNCRISNYFANSSDVKKSRLYGFDLFKKRLHEGNWPIRLEKKYASHEREVVILGRYAYLS